MEPKLRSPFTEEPLAEVVQLHDAETEDSPGAEVAVRTPPGTALVQRWYGSAVATGRDALTGTAVFREQLPSLAGLWREMAEADWAPEDAKALRFLGRAYRLLVAIPVSLVSYAGLWFVQRPLRLFLAVAVTAIALVFIVIL